MPVELTAPLTVVEAQVIPEYAPNIFVRVNAWQPSKRPNLDECDWCYWGSNIPESHLRLARTELDVEVLGQELAVEITTDQESYIPGGEAQVTIAVSDSQGKPIRAEVSLALADEAVFALSEELSPAIFDAFYGPRRLSVLTYDSMSPDRIITAPGGRGSGGPGLPLEVRSNFLDTAAWFPALETDSSGRVTVTVTLPDNLTSWRLTAKAVTLNHKVGQATANVETRKDLLIQPFLPRILTSGDRVELAALVHSYSALRTIDVSIEAPGLAIEGQAERTIVVGQDEVQKVIWTAVVQAADETTVTLRAADQDGLSDGVSLPLPVRPAAVSSVESLSGQFERDLTLVFPTMQIVPQASQVTLQLSRSRSSTILNGLEYLTGYPYGCVEQTMSRALPNAVVSRAAALLGLDPGLQERTDPLVRASIQRLYGFQHDDGGWGWWYDDRSDDYQTAWVNFGLALIAEAGYEIAPTVIERANKYLAERLAEMDARTAAFALYGMAVHGQADPAQARALTDDSINDLDPFSRAALALAFSELGDEARARALLADLEAHAVRSKGQVYWRQGAQDGEYHSKTMASTRRTTALALDAFVRIDPQNELVPGMVEYLFRNRRGLYGWGTTNETTFAVLALTNYLASQELEAGSIPFTVSLGSELLASDSLSRTQNSTTLVIPLEQLSFGLNTLEVSSGGDVPI
jgi:uncharacterized protein YfaS (alpha-2-macroglobulin family)